MKDPVDIEKILKEKSYLIDQVVEKYFPKKYKEKSILIEYISPKYKMDFEALNKTICDPFWELLDSGGKRWRPTLFFLICEALGGNPKDFLDFVVIPEIIHNGTLIADDVEDSSELRRGKFCTYKLYGLDIAVNLSQFMYFLPLMILKKDRPNVSSENVKKIYELYIKTMINLSLGQAMDIAWHKSSTSPYKISEKEYLQMSAFKTGTLARLSAEMAAILNNSDEYVKEIVGECAENIGIAFQIQDDILDLIGKKFAQKKGGLGMDITEGKLTLMIIYALNKAEASDREKIIQILKMHTKEDSLKKKVVKIIKKYGAIKYAKNFASKIVKESWNEMDKLLPSSEAKEKLRIFARYLIYRKI
jgi:geranylgeranyl pyrophosphate synthase